MFANKITLKTIVFLIIFACLGSAYGQKDKDATRVENKIDSIIKLLVKNYALTELCKFDSIVKVNNNGEMTRLKNVHQIELKKLDSIVKKANQEVLVLKKQNSDLQLKLDQSKAEFQKQLTEMLQQTMNGGVTIGKDAVNAQLALAKSYQTTNEKDFEAYVLMFNEVSALEQEFNVMLDLEKVQTKAYDLYARTSKYPGLDRDVVQLLFKLSNYCNYEQKLLDLVALSLTQSSEENRKKQILRREDDFNDYPALKAEIEKIKANREYKVTQKCNL
jgi:hypothetical protein